MCGFVGFVGGTDNQSEVLTKMMDRIVHRGPDMGGQFIDGRVALGFRRLSIDRGHFGQGYARGSLCGARPAGRF